MGAPSMNRKVIIIWIGLIVVLSGVLIDRLAESYLVYSYQGGLGRFSNNDGALMLAGLEYLFIYKPAIVAVSAFIISMLSVAMPLLIRRVDLGGAKKVVVVSTLASLMLSLVTTFARGILSA